MTATYTSNLGFTKPANGDNNNNWDVPVNLNYDLLDAAVSGSLTVSTTGGTTALTSTQGAANQARNAVIVVSGTLVSNATVNAPVTATKTYLVKNATTGAYTVTFGVTGGTGVLIPAGQWATIYCDGTNANRVVDVPPPMWGGTAGGTNNALTCSTGLGLTVMPPAGTIVCLRTNTVNTGAATIAVDSISATAIQKNGNALSAGDLPASTNVILVSDGTAWQLEGGTGSGSSGLTTSAALVNDTQNTVYAQGVTGTRQLRYNGFVDNFVDQTGIDSVNSTAVYDPTNQWYQSGNAASSFLDHFDNFSGAFVDSSSNAYLMTPTGVQTWTGFSKFGSGCAQLDGSSSYLTGPASNAAYKFNTGVDFCIEGWFYQTAAGSSSRLLSTGDGASTTSFFVYSDHTTGKLNFYTNGGATAASTAHGLNQWNHIALARSGSTITLYLNGTSILTATNSSNFSVGGMVIGANYSGTPNFFPGSIDCFRIVNGSPVYTSGFTPSTTALTAITNTTLLLQFDGSLTDTSVSGLTITNTNVALTPVPKIGTGCANFGVANAANYLTGPGAVGALGAGNWTIEGKYWPYTNAANAELVDTRASAASAVGLGIYLDTAGKLNFITNNVSTTASSAHTLNTWNDFAVIKNGTTVTLYLNGTSVGTVSNSATFTDANLFIGRLASAASTYFPGWMDELRISNIARQTGNYTPSTTAFVSDANTLLLLHFDSLNNDVSTNLVPISFYGAPHANPVFGAACARFDGSTAYLTGPSGNAAFKFPGDFTVEFCHMPLNFSSTQPNYIDTTSNSATVTGIQVSSNQTTGYLRFAAGNGSNLITTTSAPTIGKWNHIAVVRYGTTITIYLNGVSVGSYTGTVQNFSDGYLTIGNVTIGGNYRIAGYLDDLRINNTTAVYTSNFSVPSSALTAITGTSLLLHLDGGATPFADSSSNNLTITNNGTPGVICVAPKFGTGAMFFDGSTNYAKALPGPWCQFSGNFTIDMQVYISTLPTSGNAYIVFYTSPSNSGTGLFLQIYNNTGTQQVIVSNSNNSAIITATNTTLTAGSWHHVAVVRSGSSVYLFVDGSQLGSTGTAATNFSDGYLFIGAPFSGSGQLFYGFVDEARVLNGTAVWTTGFSVPTQAYTNNITLQTVPYAVGTGSPTTATAVLKLYDISGGSTLGTDIVAAISLDNGAHYTNASTYVDNGYWDTTSTYKIITAVFSGVTTGTQPIFRLTTANQKTFRIKAEAVYWS